MAYGSFTDLAVYKECRNFRKEVSAIVKKHFPPDEKYLLKPQILDSSRSVTANIAEAHGRYYFKDSAKFCRNSRGSLEETLEHLITAFDEGYLGEQILKDMKTKYDRRLLLINGYIKYLLQTKPGKAPKKPQPPVKT